MASTFGFGHRIRRAWRAFWHDSHYVRIIPDVDPETPMEREFEMLIGRVWVAARAPVDTLERENLIRRALRFQPHNTY